MEEGIEDQWVGIEGYHQVSKGQTHHEHITWGRGARMSIKYICSHIYRDHSDCKTSHILLWHTVITLFIPHQIHTLIHVWCIETLLICFCVLGVRSTSMWFNDSHHTITWWGTLGIAFSFVFFCLELNREERNKEYRCFKHFCNYKFVRTC